MTVDTSHRESTRRAIYRRGQSVTFTRLSGAAPNSVEIPTGGATVTAFVERAQIDTTGTSETGYSASQIGAMPLIDRKLLVMRDDLLAAGFPGDPRKNDRIALTSPDDTLTVVRVDPNVRSIADAIEIYAAGIA